MSITNLKTSIFFINSALRVSNLSVYSYEERVEQMMETLDSIDKYCPVNLKYIFDSSVVKPDPKHLQQLSRKSQVVWCGNIPQVSEFSSYGTYGSRGIAETIAFIHFITWFKSLNMYQGSRIYKLSGRYRLNDNFVADDPSYKDAFVFAAPEKSWMSDERKQESGAYQMYKLRLWHMDGSLLDTFYARLPAILQDCATYGIDVEHSYYKHLSRYKTVEVRKIGVCGNTAPDGVFINE
jgi:hypothetical protein